MSPILLYFLWKFFLPHRLEKKFPWKKSKSKRTSHRIPQLIFQLLPQINCFSYRFPYCYQAGPLKMWSNLGRAKLINCHHEIQLFRRWVKKLFRWEINGKRENISPNHSPVFPISHKINCFFNHLPTLLSNGPYKLHFGCSLAQRKCLLDLWITQALRN